MKRLLIRGGAAIALAVALSAPAVEAERRWTPSTRTSGP